MLILPKGQSHSVVGESWYISLHETKRRVNSVRYLQSSFATFTLDVLRNGHLCCWGVRLPRAMRQTPRSGFLGSSFAQFVLNNVCMKHVGSVADVDGLVANVQYLGLSAELGLELELELGLCPCHYCQRNFCLSLHVGFAYLAEESTR